MQRGFNDHLAVAAQAGRLVVARDLIPQRDNLAGVDDRHQRLAHGLLATGVGEARGGALREVLHSVLEGAQLGFEHPVEGLDRFVNVNLDAQVALRLGLQRLGEGLDLLSLASEHLPVDVFVHIQHLSILLSSYGIHTRHNQRIEGG